jgi:hypothetical protein
MKRKMATALFETGAPGILLGGGEHRSLAHVIRPGRRSWSDRRFLARIDKALTPPRRKSGTRAGDQSQAAASHPGCSRHTHLKQAYIYFTARVKRDPSLQLVGRFIASVKSAGRQGAASFTAQCRALISRYRLKLATCEHLQPAMPISETRFDLGN